MIQPQSPDQHPFAISSRFSPATAPHPLIDTVAKSSAKTWWFICKGAKLLTVTGQSVGEPMAESTYSLPQAASLEELGLSAVRTQFLGYLEGCPCVAAEVENIGEKARESLSAGAFQNLTFQNLTFQNLRSLHTRLPEDLFAIAARAVQLIEWDRNHQYCGHCAMPTLQLPTERVKSCPQCHLRQYPKLSPAVIMLIYKGDQLLLSREPRFRPGMYSVLAGFVEPGESLEEAVARETREEVGLEIQNIRYFGSQPWPFPNSLMMGFTAEYASGNITPAPGEIEEAAWFDKANLPPIPGNLSISRKLIDWFVRDSVN